MNLNKIQTVIVMLFINLFSFIGIYNIFLGTAINYWYIWILIGYICIQMLGINACYHRLICHKSFNVNPIIRKILLFFGIIAGQGSPIFWASVHRSHHKNEDTDKDIHSPTKGFWNSYVLWTYKISASEINIKLVTDLLRDKELVFIHKHYVKLFFLFHFLIALISFDIWLYSIIIPTLITLHCSSFQTSFVHIKKLGYQNYKEKNSVNCPIIFPLILGEAWHNNHHGDPSRSNFGLKWWEIDPTYWLIKLIKK